MKIEAKTNRSNEKRVLFSANSAPGHFHPVLPLAFALKEAGHQVAFATSPARRTMLEEAGFTFFPLTVNSDKDPEYRRIKAELAGMPLSLESELYAYPRLFAGVGTRLKVPKLIEIGQEWQPDMFIREAAGYSAVIAAEYLGVPHVVIGFTATLKGMAVFEREVAGQLEPLRREWGLAPDPEVAALYRYLQLSYSPPSFAKCEVDYQGFSGAIPRTTHFIRPQLFDHSPGETLPEWLGELPDQPTIYVTLGTEVNSEPTLYPRVLQTIIAGLRDLPVNLIITLGRDKDPADFGPQPANVHIERYIPQSLLLPYCDVMVQHGGSNTLLSALEAGISPVIIPLIADQFFNAAVAGKLQLAPVVQLDQLTPASIRAAVEEVPLKPVYRQNIKRLQTEMRHQPDINYAVRLVERVITEGHPVFNPDL